MATRGFLIRFIDIGLIVLFGFLMISDIEASSRVELGGTAEVQEEAPEADEDQGFILVEIAADGAFLVAEGPSDQPLSDASETPPEADASETPPEDDTPQATRQGQRVRVESVAGLEDAMRILREAHRAAGLETVVLIEPHPASAVQRTVDVMDASDRLGLPKSLRMDIEVVGRSGAPEPGGSEGWP